MMDSNDFWNFGTNSPPTFDDFRARRPFKQWENHGRIMDHGMDVAREDDEALGESFREICFINNHPNFMDDKDHMDDKT